MSLQIVKKTTTRPPTVSTKGKPQINIGPDEMRVADEAIAALATCGDIYQRGGNLVRVIIENGAPRIKVMAPATLREAMASAADWYRPGPKEPIQTHPPIWAVAAVGARGQWDGIPELRAVTETPVLRLDGSILQRKGYDPATKLLYLPNCTYPVVPPKPTLAQAKAAVAILLDMFSDFPFAAETHRSAALAGAITPIARSAYEGPAPFFLVDGNTRGSGKGLLVDVAASLFSANGIGRSSQSTDDAEERKCITSVALRGVPVVLIDNISRPFGSGPLDSALTSVTWSDRVLNTNDLPTLPLVTTWWGTGNNVQFRSGADTARRALHIRLASPEEKPEERADFKYPNLLAHVRAHRQNLVVAALTLLSAYCAAGRPKQKMTPWGSYECWSELVRGAIVWAGLADPFEGHDDLVEAADNDAAGLGGLLEAWADLCIDQGQAHEGRGPKGCTVADAVRVLEEDRIAKCSRFGLREALAELIPTKPGSLPDTRAIGYQLRRYRERVVDGKRLSPIGCKTNKGARWAVTTAPKK